MRAQRILCLFVLFAALFWVSCTPAWAATLSITKDATSITTDDGTRRLVTRSNDVSFGKEAYHTSIDAGLTNLIESALGGQLVGQWGDTASTTFQVLEATPTFVRVLNSNSNNIISFTTYPDGRSYLFFESNTYKNIDGSRLIAPLEVRVLDAVNYTFTSSDITNLNHAGVSVVPYNLTDMDGSSNWPTDQQRGFMWWKSNPVDSIPGTLLVDQSVFRATETTTATTRDDYRNPDDLSDGLTQGSGWFDATEFTTAPTDYYNERQGAYLLDASNGRVALELDGGTYLHARPVFKIRSWTSQDDPALVSLNGTTQVNGTDFNADITPFSEAHFFDASAGTYTQLADAGLPSSANEYLYREDADYTLPFTVGESNDFIAFGSTSKYRGVLVDLAQAGSGNNPTLTWEYWSGSQWAALSVMETEAGVSNLTQSGKVYWTEDPTGWAAMALNAGRSLYYVRARLTSGDYNNQAPVENRLTTDILILQSFATVSSNNTAFVISTDSLPPELTLSAFPEFTQDNTPTLTGTATDEASSVAAVAYQMNGTAGEWTDCTASDGNFDESEEAFSCTVDPTLIDGNHQIYFRSSDANGNLTASDAYPTVSFSVDTQRPATNATGVGFQNLDSGEWTNTEPVISWTPGADNAGGVGLLGYCLSLDEATIGSSTLLDPELSGGLFAGLDDGVASDACPYIVSSSSVDLSGISGLTITANRQIYVSIKAVDQAGNVWSGDTGDYQDLVSFKYDNIAPENPDYLSLPSDFIATRSATLMWPTSGSSAAYDGESGVAGLQYRIGVLGTWYGDNHTGTEDMNDLLANNGSYETHPEYDFDDLDEGSNTIYLRTFDLAGNVTTGYITGALKINTTAPSSPQDLTVDPEDNTTNSYDFGWDPPAIFVGEAANLSYCYVVNALPSEINCQWTGAGASQLATDAYATQPGNNILYLVAKDEAGNINYETYASVGFAYLGSAPGSPRNIDVADISIKVTSNWKLAVSWDPPSDLGAGVATYKVYRSITAATCSANFGVFTQIGSTSGSSYSDTGLAQRTYYYCVRACDNANNCGAASSTVSGYPDGRYTSAASLISGPAVSSITTKRATISWTTGRDSDSKVAYGTSSGDYYDEEPSNSTQTTDHIIKLTNLSPGTTYYYRAKWTDEDGNTGESEEKTFTTQAAPTIKDVSASNVSISSAMIEFTSIGATKVNLYYGITTAFGGVVEIPTSTVESSYLSQLTGLEDGVKYYYKLNSYDSEDDEYEGTVLDFTTLPRPRISNVRIQQVRNTAQPTMLATWNSNTAISSIVTYYPQDDPMAARDEIDIELTEGNHQMIIRGLLPGRLYSLMVKGRDKVGNEATSQVQTFTTATDTRPPLMSNLRIEGSVVPPTTSAGQEQNAQLIVTWNTDEPATSQVEYGEGSGTSYAHKTQEDTKLTYNHMVIISNLTPSKVYHLRAISADEAGNIQRSIDTVTITPKATDNAFDLVISNLVEAFSFLGESRR